MNHKLYTSYFTFGYSIFLLSLIHIDVTWRCGWDVCVMSSEESALSCAIWNHWLQPTPMRCFSLTKLGVCRVCHLQKRHASAVICSLADNSKELSAIVIQRGIQRILTVPLGTVERTVSGIWYVIILDKKNVPLGLSFFLTWKTFTCIFTFPHHQSRIWVACICIFLPFHTANLHQEYIAHQVTITSNGELILWSWP